jgi:hypothetical protein
MSGASATTKITDAKMQILNISDNFEKFLLPQRQMICGPSMSGKIEKKNVDDGRTTTFFK